VSVGCGESAATPRSGTRPHRASHRRASHRRASHRRASHRRASGPARARRARLVGGSRARRRRRGAGRYRWLSVGPPRSRPPSRSRRPRCPVVRRRRCGSGLRWGRRRESAMRAPFPPGPGRPRGPAPGRAGRHRAVVAPVGRELASPQRPSPGGRVGRRPVGVPRREDQVAVRPGPAGRAPPSPRRSPRPTVPRPRPRPRRVLRTVAGGACGREGRREVADEVAAAAARSRRLGPRRDGPW
jgi:hypothetical protein